MLAVEHFSHCAWATPHALLWNRRNKRGVLFRGHGRIGCSEVIPIIIKEAYKPVEVSTWGT